MRVKVATPKGSIHPTERRRFLTFLRPRRKLKVTAEGKVYILLTLGVGMAAINTGNNMLFLVLGFMLSIIIVSGIISELTLRGLDVRRKLPVLPWAGEVSAVEISVHNRKWIPSFCIEVQDVASNFTIDRRCFFLKIGGKKAQSTAYHCVFPRRGVYNFTGMIVMTRFPFGLFSKSYKIEDRDNLTVAPRRVHVTTDLLEPIRQGEMTTGTKADRIDIEPSNIRPFLPGDNPRRINWKLSASHGRLIITEGMEHNQKYVNLLFDEKLLSSAEAITMDSLAPTIPPATGEKERALLPENIFEHQIDLAASTAEAFALKGYNLWFATRRKVIGPLAPQQANLIILELATLAPLKDASEAPPHLPDPPAGPAIYFNRVQPTLRRGEVRYAT